MDTFSHPHGSKLRCRFLHASHQLLLRKGCFVNSAFAGMKQVRYLQKISQPWLILQAELHLQLFCRFHISGGKVPINQQLPAGLAVRLHCDIHIRTPPLDILGNAFLDAVFQRQPFPVDPDRGFRVTVVHRSHFNLHAESGNSPAGLAKAGHTANHAITSDILF
ncbi:hypothetical protein D3C75_1035350 [compost metagenome]